jgi:DnaJ-domain-containing protein 1
VARNLPETELKERVALLKRFKELLIEQRRRFHYYIEVLDKQKNAIENGSVEDIQTHVELDEKMTAGIMAIQKTIEPMRPVCAAVADGDAEIPEISAALENLKNETAKRIETNKNLLQKRMVLIRNELKNLAGGPLSRRKSIYAETQSATLFDISG